MRIILFVIVLILIILLGAVIGPNFVDWNKYKPTIITQVKKTTGLDVQIDGDISLSVLPLPRVKIEDLTVVAPRKIEFENLLKIKSAEVSVELVPLLSKKILVDSVALIEPVIQIEMLADGTPSWETEKISKMKQVSGAVPAEAKQGVSKAASRALNSISLNKLEIKKGTLSFIDHKTKASHKVNDMHAILKANSLKGPFIGKGHFLYDGNHVVLDVTTGKLPKKGGVLDLQLRVTLSNTGAILAFSGVTTMQKPFDLQGKTAIQVDSLYKLSKVFGSDLGSQYDKRLSMDGLLSFDEDSFSYNDLKVSFDEFVGNGKIAVKNMKQKNPITVSGILESKSTLDIEPFLTVSKKDEKAGQKGGQKRDGSGASKSKGLVPDTLTLPATMNVDFKMNVGGVKAKDVEVKGLIVDLAKSGDKAGISFKALGLPGQGKADGSLNLSYGSSSKSPKTGQVVYSNPTADYQINGQVGQLESFLKAFVPKVNTDAVTNFYKTAEFNLKGSIKNSVISLKDSVVKLDKTIVGVGGRYEPTLGGRPKVTVDLSADSIDFDQFQKAQNTKKGATGNSDSNNKEAGPKEALKPIQELSLPMDLVFDISLQKARMNNADVSGVRLTGNLFDKELTLKNASVNNLAGAAMALKGEVHNISQLSGLNLQLYTKTSDAPRLAKALKIDVSKLPKELKSLEANITGKGQTERMSFTATIRALGGDVEAAGIATSILDNPAFSNLTLRLRHSNLVKAVQIVSPEFKGATGLQQPIDFYTKAVIDGKNYTLSDMQAKLGDTAFDGNLKIDASQKIPAIRGSLQADHIALDEFLGAKKSSKSSGGGKPSSGSGSSSGERWSKAPINLDWMRTIDVEVVLAASSITYGTWNFTRPSTELIITLGSLVAKDMRAGVFGGQAELDAQVKANPVSLEINSEMKDIDLESLAKALSGSGKLKSTGRVSFATGVVSSGASPHALINALNGSAELEGRNVVLKGFDLAKLARGLAVKEKLATSVTSLVDGATKGGQTEFDTISGRYKIKNGIANISAMSMDGPAALIITSGYADFPKWFINLDNEIRLKEVKGLEPFSVKVKGPLDNPSDTFGKNILEDYVGDKIKRKLGKELPDILGGDVTDKLEKFGILPQKQQPAPEQQAPANGNPEPTEQVPAQPVEQQKQEDFDAEDVVKDVLKGFF